jgi:hypothetical protein
MDALEQLLHQTEELAANHGMHVYVVGSLFKISPIDVPENPILEVECENTCASTSTAIASLPLSTKDGELKQSR